MVTPSMPVWLPPQDRKSYAGPLEIAFRHLSQAHALTVHSQSLERLAERGGMSPRELVCNIKHLSLLDVYSIPLKEAEAFLTSLENQNEQSPKKSPAQKTCSAVCSSGA